MPHIRAPTGRRTPVTRIGCPTSRRHLSTQRDVGAGWARRYKRCAALIKKHQFILTVLCQTVKYVCNAGMVFSKALCASARTLALQSRVNSVCAFWRRAPVWTGSVTFRATSSRNTCVRTALHAFGKVELRSSFAFPLLFVPSTSSRFGEPPIHVLMHDIKLVHPARDFRF